MLDKLKACPADFIPLMLKIFSNNLKGFRKQRKLSQLELSKKSGVSLGIIKTLENSIYWTSGKTIGALCRALEISYDRLFDEKADFTAVNRVNEKSLKEVFALNLARFMYYRNVTQEYLSKSTGIKIRTLSNFATACTLPSPEKIKLIAKALDVKIWILFREIKTNLPLKIEKEIFISMTKEQRTALALQILEFERDEFFDFFYCGN